ncbi:MAG: hypothetical protein NXY57DRAFT_1059800 [Lentinula lateritia]|nr:MAG: hypothetical protein NXY57DRAFT_1059800 [Lentinula lateritia]
MSHGPTYLGGLGGLLFLLEGGLRALNTIRYYPRRFPFITRVLKPRYLHGPPATLSFARILVLQTQFVELLLGKACLVALASEHPGPVTFSSTGRVTDIDRDLCRGNLMSGAGLASLAALPRVAANLTMEFPSLYSQCTSRSKVTLGVLNGIYRRWRFKPGLLVGSDSLSLESATKTIPARRELILLSFTGNAATFVDFLHLYMKRATTQLTKMQIRVEILAKET